MRRKNDAYFTPDEQAYKVVKALLDNSPTDHLLSYQNNKLKRIHGAISMNTVASVLFIEPCAGDGSISRAIKQWCVEKEYQHFTYAIVSLDIDPQFEECTKYDFRDFSFDTIYSELCNMREEGTLKMNEHASSVMANTDVQMIHVVTNPPYKIESLDRWKGMSPKRQSAGTDADGNKLWTPPMINVAAKLGELAKEIKTRSKSIQNTVSVTMSCLLRVTQLEPTSASVEAMQMLSSLIVLPRISFTGDGKTDSSTTAWFSWADSLVYVDRLRIMSKDKL